MANIWDRRKGLNYLVELSKRLDDRYKVIIVGVTEKQKEKLPQNVIGITKTNNVKQLVEIYSTADVFVNPTLEDNFPTTNLEAIACGTPVITFETGGSGESINEKCGFSVKKGDIERVLNIIIKLKMLSIDREELHKKSILFDKRYNFNKYIDIYK